VNFLDQFGNPYDPNVDNVDSQTPPLDQIIVQAIATAMMKMRVYMPGQITQILGNQKVHVQPLLQTRYTNASSGSNLPVIQNVQVGMPMGQNYSIKLPISVGDQGHILFSDRSLDIWKNSAGGIVDPQDSRTHDMTDAVFIPGLPTFSQQTNDTTTDLVLTAGQAQIRMAQSGGFKFLNLSQNQELITILLSLLDTLINKTFTSTLLGPQPFIAVTQEALTTIQTNLETLKE
jgi:hypothetical protein